MEARGRRRRRYRVGRSALKLLAALSALVTIWSFLEGRVPEPAEAPAEPSVVAPEPPHPIAHGVVEALADPRSPEIVLCEVVVKGPGVDPAGERITLCNRGTATVGIGDWELTDGEGVYSIPDGIVLSPGESWSVTGAEVNPRRSPQRIWLNDASDEVRLLDAFGSLVDSCGWPPKESSATCLKAWE